MPVPANSAPDPDNGSVGCKGEDQLLLICALINTDTASQLGYVTHLWERFFFQTGAEIRVNKSFQDWNTFLLSFVTHKKVEYLSTECAGEGSMFLACIVPLWHIRDLGTYEWPCVGANQSSPLWTFYKKRRNNAIHLRGNCCNIRRHIWKHTQAANVIDVPLFSTLAVNASIQRLQRFKRYSSIWPSHLCSFCLFYKHKRYRGFRSFLVLLDYETYNLQLGGKQSNNSYMNSTLLGPHQAHNRTP